MAAVVEKENLVDNSGLKDGDVDDSGAKEDEGNESWESEKEDLTIDETRETDSEDSDDSDNPAKLIVEGKRQRTTVKAFTSAPPVKEKKPLEFEVGKGSLLGEIDIVSEYMTKTSSEDYRALHRLMYNVNGVTLQRKRNVRRFNGFSFDKDSKEYDTKLAAIKKLKSSDRKLSMKLMGLKQSSTVQEFMDFLMSPEDSGKHAPSKRKSKTPSKRKRSTVAKDEETPPKKKKKQKKKTPSKPKAKPKPSTTPKRKKPVPKKKETDDEVDEEEDSLSESESLSEELVEETNASKKRKLSESITDISIEEAGPSNKELIKSIKKTVEDIDLEEVSMKQALTKIYDLYPDFDLTARKSFIKDNIRKLIG